MNKYVALLRAVNVSGANKIRMAELKELFLEFGFSNPMTYLQSGNVVFSSSQNDTKLLEELISSKIKDHYGYDIEVFVLPKLSFLHVYSNNPFHNKVDLEVKKLCVVFLSSLPKIEEFDEINNNPSLEEKMTLDSRIIYMYCKNGFGKAKVTNNYLERKLKLNATTRNWNTVTNLQRLLSEL